MSRRVEDESGRCPGKFKFLPFDAELGFLFRLFAFGNLCAERAGMFAVERSRHGLVQRRCPKIVREHRRPGDRLQDDPMRAGHREHGCYQEYPSNSSEHRKTVGDGFIAVKVAPLALIQIEFAHTDLSREKTNCSRSMRILIKG